MSFKAKLIEKAAEQAVQAAAGAVGKHISQKAVDHTISTAKKKVTAGYEYVRESLTGQDESVTHTPSLTYVLSDHDRQMLHTWYRHAVVNGNDTQADVALHKRLCGDLL